MPGLKRKDTSQPKAAKGGSGVGSGSGNGNDSAFKKQRRLHAPATTTSSLPAQEVDFPRGGGSNLTPFEHKQVLNEVKAESQQKRRDAQASQKRQHHSAAGDDDLFREGGSSSKSTEGVDKKKLYRDKKNAQKKKRDLASVSSSSAKGKGKDKARANTEEEGERPARIEVLNYKRINVGTRLLCTVLAVHPLAAVLSLPNQLLGHVPITNVSEVLTQRLESAADSDDDDGNDGEDDDSIDGDDDDNEDDGEQSSVASEGGDESGSTGMQGVSTSRSGRADSKLPELRDILQVGQWVCASVVAMHSGGANRSDRGREGAEYEQESQRVELSLDPAMVNDGVSATDLCPGFVLPLTVKSKEDHGYLLDTAVSDMRAFVSFKEAHDAVPALHVGQVVLGTVESLSSNRRTISVSLHSSKVAKAIPETVPSSSAMLPGNLLNALVTNESSQGLNVKLFGMFDGTIDAVHLPSGSEYKIGQRLKARVLWEVPPQMQDDVTDRKFALSAAPHVTQLSPRGNKSLQEYPIGTTVNATVVNTIEDWGLTCELRDAGALKAFVHISNVSDDHIARLPANSGAFRIGTVHEARIIGHALTDDILRLSLQGSVLQRAFMRVSEVVVGEIIKCTIKAIKPQAIVLDLNGSVDGVVFPIHFADVPLKKPEKKFKVGQSVTARVWQVDPERNRIALTLKRTLVQSELAVVGSLQDSRVGIVTHGVVSRVLEGNVGASAILVDLYGNLRAYVPISEALENINGASSALSLDAVKTSFFAGKAVKVRLTRVDYDTGRITASIRQASESFLQRLNVDAVQVGESVQGKLAAIHQDVLVLELQPSNVRALLGLNSLARERKTTVDELRDALTEGEIISNLKVLDKKADRGIVIVGGASSKAKSELANGSPALREADLKTGAVVSARATRKEGNCITLHVGNMLRCSLHATDCADDYGDSPASSILPAEGSQVRVSLLDVRGSSTNRRAQVSMRPSRLEGPSAGKVRDAEINSIEDLHVGSKYRGFVRAVAEKNGLFVELGRSITARVMIAELFDDYVKDWTSRFTIGQLVQGTVTALDASAKKIEMSLRSERERRARGKGVPDKQSSSADAGNRLAIRDIEEGQKYKAFVKGIAEYGIFVQIEGTRLSGLAHKSQLSDDSRPDDALKAFNIGDQVKAYVLKVDAAKQKLSFGLKPSLFSTEDFADSEVEDDDDDEIGEGASDNDDHLEDQSDNDDDDDESDKEMDAEALLQDGSDEDEKLLDIDHDEGSDEDDEDDDEASGDEDSEESDAAISADDVAPNGAMATHGDRFESDDDDDDDDDVTVAPALSLKSGLTWNGMDATRDGNDQTDDSEGSSDDSDDGTASRAKRRRNKKITQEDLTADLASKMPETSTDFDRLLLGSPNSSYLWIQYISFYVQLGDVSNARETAQRALQTIHFREEQEKFNVWIALLNLENTYGNDASLEKTFKEACSFNDAQAVHVRLAEILEQSGKVAAAQEQWKRTTKRFGFHPDVWVSYHRFLLRHEPSGQEARSMVARSMQSLEKRNHVETIVAYALDEFKLGDAERGRTIFEGLVDSYPKRLDIWLQYIDQEARLGHVVQVRELYERTLALKQSSKKVKSILKKWLDFEKRKGTDQTQQAVLERARRFIQEREQTHEEEDGTADADQDSAAAADDDDEDDEAITMDGAVSADDDSEGNVSEDEVDEEEEDNGSEDEDEDDDDDE